MHKNLQKNAAFNLFNVKDVYLFWQNLQNVWPWVFKPFNYALGRALSLLNLQDLYKRLTTAFTNESDAVLLEEKKK